MWKIKGWVCFKGLQDVSCWSNLCCIINFPRVIFLILCSFLLLFFFLWRTINSPNIIFLILCSSPFLQHRRYILVIGHALAQFSSKWKLQTLSLSDQQFLCAVFIISFWGHLCHLATDSEVYKFYNLRFDVTSSTCKTQIFEDAPTKTKHIECKRRLFEIWIPAVVEISKKTKFGAPQHFPPNFCISQSIPSHFCHLACYASWMRRLLFLTTHMYCRFCLWW